MRDQLIQYVNLLFAGAESCEDMKQEILQNTLDRYDDLITAGKVPEAAYRLAITGIGDLSEILGTGNSTQTVRTYTIAEKTANSTLDNDSDTPAKKLGRAIAVGLYILCPLPLIILSEIGLEIIGLCGLLAIVAVATVLIILCAKKDNKQEEEEKVETPLRRSINSLIWAVGLSAYFILSFTTQAWYITWLCFPIIGAVKELITAILDYKEVE